MFELLLLVCLAKEPARCEEIYLAPEGGGMMQCLANGQFQATRWAEEHPGYVVKRWRCGQPRA